MEVRYNRLAPATQKVSEPVPQHYKDNQLQKLELYMINVGMTLQQDVRTQDGMVLVARGQQVDFRIWKRLQNFYYSTPDPKPVLVRVPSSSPNMFGPKP